MTRKERIQKFYSKKPSIISQGIPKKEQESRSVGWRSKDSANESYSAASSYAFLHDKEIKSVLDVGAGLGGFLSFLRHTRGFDGNYYGIEILEDFFSYANTKYLNDPMAKFVCGDFLLFPLDNHIFDWSFSIGSLSVIQEDQKHENSKTILKMYAVSKFGFSIFLNDANKCQVLKGHDIDNFVTQIHELLPNCKAIEVNPFGKGNLPAKTMIHVLK